MTHPQELPHDPKRFATLQAIAALAGVLLVRTESDKGGPLYVASRWALTRSFDTLDDVSAWLSRVTGKSDADIRELVNRLHAKRAEVAQ